MTLAIVCCMGWAQTVNPLNYSGKMYVKKFEIITTPRYISYEDHAILSTEMNIPALKVMECMLDFDKGIVTFDDKSYKVKVTAAKRYFVRERCDYDVVLYMDMLDGSDKVELVWPDSRKPYLQQITKETDGVSIVRIILSDKLEDESDAAF